MAVDTLQLSKDLQGVAFTRDQADVLARIILEHTNGRLQGETEGLARRLDVMEFSLQILHDAMTRGFDKQRAASKTESRELRAEIKEGDASLKVDLVKWIVGSLVLNLVGTAGAMITRIKLIPH